ncbi:pyruvate/2-oxoglutarate dehydrogenase complex, dihydrolipoamide acyltransferase component [Saccharomonospora marina XMU15]|uniref:Dihydrolipoamide acetyltransferase component of pyruvate dehydrogenase complex n=2 Tax=Saccharomonospora TaxID=1851 RepID=H5X0S0_9PSEU|nr:pyruvate/2-oxoglutarate dehydrogenase complex, dihydrolipoamide acyltransferase component [Saccharomonospora marina XMU15]
MPSLGADMDEGTVLEWLVRPGQRVAKGDIVAVVDTAKAAVDVECFDSGVVESILVPAGEKVPVGTPLAVIGAGEAQPSEPPVGHAPATGQQPKVEPEPKPEPKPEPGSGSGSGSGPKLEPEPEPQQAAPAQQRVSRERATPPVRSLARQAGIDLATVHGTGPEGTVTHADIERLLAPRRRRVSPYARRLAHELGVDVSALPGTVHARDVRAAAGNRPSAATAAETAAVEPRRSRGEDMRAAIATLMERSKREIPHYYLSSTIDLDAALSWLREYNRDSGIADRVLPNALLLKATALAAARVGELNGHWLDGGFRRAQSVRLGVAVSLRGGGLLVPTLEEPDSRPLEELMRTLTDVVSRTRSGRLRSSELRPATITVTNLGDLGAESVQGVIYPPQVAVVGFGAIVRRPWAVGELLGVRPVVTAGLAADHRATDGATGSRFLNALDTVLQRPEELR